MAQTQAKLLSDEKIAQQEIASDQAIVSAELASTEQIEATKAAAEFESKKIEMIDRAMGEQMKISSSSKLI